MNADCVEQFSARVLGDSCLRVFTPGGAVTVPDELNRVVEVGGIEVLLCEVDGPGSCEDGGYGHACGQRGPVPF